MANVSRYRGYAITFKYILISAQKRVVGIKHKCLENMASHLGLHCLLRPIYPSMIGKYNGNPEKGFCIVWPMYLQIQGVCYDLYIYSYFCTKTYVVGNKHKCLDNMFLCKNLSTFRLKKFFLEL